MWFTQQTHVSMHYVSFPTCTLMLALSADSLPRDEIYQTKCDSMTPQLTMVGDDKCWMASGRRTFFFWYITLFDVGQKGRF